LVQGESEEGKGQNPGTIVSAKDPERRKSSEQKL
jgi:hypothetical protein